MSPLSGVLGEAWGYYRRFAAHFLIIAFAIYLGAAIIVLLLSLAGSFGAFIGVIINLIAAFLVQAALVKAVQDVRDGRADLDLGETVRAALPFVVPVAVASILASIGIAIGFILIIVPGLILLTFWSLIVPSIVIGGEGITSSFSKSWRTVRGYAWHVFGTYVLVFLILIVFDIVLGLILVALPLLARSFISSIVSGTLVAPFLALVVTLVYYRLTAAHGAAAADGGPGYGGAGYGGPGYGGPGYQPPAGGPTYPPPAGGPGYPPPAGGPGYPPPGGPEYQPPAGGPGYPPPGAPPAGGTRPFSAGQEPTNPDPPASQPSAGLRQPAGYEPGAVPRVLPRGARRGPAPGDGLPDVAAPPVAGQLAGQVERHGHRQHVDGIVILGRALDAGRGERRGRPLPRLPAARRVEAPGLLGGPERAQVVGATDDALGRRHQRRPVPAPAPVRADPDGFHVPGAQRPALVHQPALDHRCVPDEHGPVPGQRVHAAERVLPVSVRHAVEHVEEQGPRGREGGRAQVSGMGGAQRGHAQHHHRPAPPRRGNNGPARGAAQQQCGPDPA